MSTKWHVVERWVRHGDVLIVTLEDAKTGEVVRRTELDLSEASVQILQNMIDEAEREREE